MSKKHLSVPNGIGNAHISRPKKGKKQRRHENDVKKHDDEKAILEFYSRQRDDANQTKIAICLFFVGGLVAFVAVLCKRYHCNEGITAGQHPAPFNSNTRRGTSLSELYHIACKKTRLLYCEKGAFEIQDDTRSIRARQEVLLKVGQKILEIPRNVQMTTIDALRDPRVNRLLRKNPRHPLTGKPLRPQTFLAVYMNFELSQLQKSSNNFDVLTPEEELQRAYLAYLPTDQDFLRFHPISRMTRDYNSTKKHTDTLPALSLTEHLVDAYFRSFLAEYHAFCRISSDFENHVPLEDWITSRLIVNTRSFKSVPLTPNDISNDELESYRPFLHDMEDDKQTQTDVDSSRAAFYDDCRHSSMRSCMVPLLDALDHHAKPNIGWRFMDSQSPVSEALSFLAFASEDVTSGSNLFVSYGSFPDPLVFAQYGFVDPSGLGHRAALLAPYHHLVDETFLTEEESMHIDNDLQKYLAFRDGYQHCHYSTHEKTQRLEFETAKFEALKAMSNVMKSWVATLPPPHAERKRDWTLLELELVEVLSMCRLLATTHRDYAGRATEMLRTVASAEHPEYFQFRVSSDKATSEGLEYRTWHVLERLSNEMRSSVRRSLVHFAAFPSVKSQHDGLGFDAVGSNSDTDTDWTLIEHDLRQGLNSHTLDPSSSMEAGTVVVLLGELETLKILSERAGDKKRLLSSNNHEKEVLHEEDYIVRQNPCTT